MGIEIERRFFFDTLPEEAPEKILDIEQAYLSRNPVLRIRKSLHMTYLDGALHYTGKGSYQFTFKGKKKGRLGKEEYNREIVPETYGHLRDKSDGFILHKKRYVYALSDDLYAEADVFEEIYEGLKIVEVEFKTEAEAEAFTPPKWFGEEITGRKELSNASLAYDTRRSVRKAKA